MRRQGDLDEFVNDRAGPWAPLHQGVERPEQSSYVSSQELSSRQNAMYIVNVHQAKTELSRLLARAEAGEDVVIARRGQPVARLVPCRVPAKRRPDILKSKIVVPDAFFDPLPEDELTAWEGG